MLLCIKVSLIFIIIFCSNTRKIRFILEDFISNEKEKSSFQKFRARHDHIWTYTSVASYKSFTILSFKFDVSKKQEMLSWRIRRREGWIICASVIYFFFTRCFMNKEFVPGRRKERRRKERSRKIKIESD